MIARCAYIKGNGQRCKGVPVRTSQWCAAHHPDYKEQRRRGASKGGRATKSNPVRTELQIIRDQVRVIIGGVLAQKIDRGAGSVAIQGFNTLLRAVELERRLRETEELAKRLDEIEDELERRRRGYGN